MLLTKTKTEKHEEEVEEENRGERMIKKEDSDNDTIAKTILIRQGFLRWKILSMMTTAEIYFFLFYFSQRGSLLYCNKDKYLEIL